MTLHDLLRNDDSTLLSIETELKRLASLGSSKIKKILLKKESERYNLISGYTPLHLAAKNHPDAIPLLLTAIAKLNDPKLLKILLMSTQIHGYTPLHRAARYQPGAIPLLLTAIAELNDPELLKTLLITTEQQGYTPLHLAAQLQPDAIPLLLTAIAELNDPKLLKTLLTATMNDGRTPLHLATQYQPAATPLLLATIAELNNPEFLKTLLKNTEKYGYTPLHLAAQYQPAAIPLILKAIAELNDPKLLKTLLMSTQLQGFTPLHLAAASQPDAIPLLLTAIAKLNDPKLLKTLLITTEQEGYTPLHLAARLQPDAIPLLLTAIAELNDPKVQKTLLTATMNDGQTPLHLAAQHQPAAIPDLLTAIAELDDPEFLKKLLTATTPKCGYTPLHLAARLQPDAIPLLLTAIAELNDPKFQKTLLTATMNDGHTPLHLAATHQPAAIPTLLMCLIDITLAMPSKQEKTLITQLMAALPTHYQTRCRQQLSKIINDAKTSPVSKILLDNNLTDANKIERLEHLTRLLNENRCIKEATLVNKEIIAIQHSKARKNIRDMLRTCKPEHNFSTQETQKLLNQLNTPSDSNPFNFLDVILERRDIGPIDKQRLIIELLYHTQGTRIATATLNTQKALSYFLENPEKNNVIIPILAYHQKLSNQSNIIRFLNQWVQSIENPLDNNQKNMILSLLELSKSAHENINEQTSHGDTLLHTLCKKSNDPEFLEKSIKMGLSRNIKNTAKQLPWQIATDEKNYNAALALKPKNLFSPHKKEASTESNNQDNDNDESIVNGTLIMPPLPVLLEWVRSTRQHLETIKPRLDKKPITPLMVARSFFQQPNGGTTAALRLSLADATAPDNSAEYSELVACIALEHNMPGLV